MVGGLRKSEGQPCPSEDSLPAGMWMDAVASGKDSQWLSKLQSNAERRFPGFQGKKSEAGVVKKSLQVHPLSSDKEATGVVACIEQIHSVH